MARLSQETSDYDYFSSSGSHSSVSNPSSPNLLPPVSSSPCSDALFYLDTSVVFRSCSTPKSTPYMHPETQNALLFNVPGPQSTTYSTFKTTRLLTWKGFSGNYEQDANSDSLPIASVPVAGPDNTSCESRYDNEDSDTDSNSSGSESNVSSPTPEREVHISPLQAQSPDDNIIEGGPYRDAFTDRLDELLLEYIEKQKDSLAPAPDEHFSSYFSRLRPISTAPFILTHRNQGQEHNTGSSPSSPDSVLITTPHSLNAYNGYSPRSPGSDSDRTPRPILVTTTTAQAAFVVHRTDMSSSQTKLACSNESTTQVEGLESNKSEKKGYVSYSPLTLIDHLDIHEVVEYNELYDEDLDDEDLEVPFNDADGEGDERDIDIDIQCDHSYLHSPTPTKQTGLLLVKYPTWIQSSRHGIATTYPHLVIRRHSLCITSSGRPHKRRFSFTIADHDITASVNKRAKLQAPPTPITHRTQSFKFTYATKPASLRRAFSLRSDASEKTPTPVLPYRIVQRDYLPENGSGTRTIPVTPILQNRTHRKNIKSSERGQRLEVFPILNPVPIIAPPPDLVPRLPLSEEAQAKVRLSRFVEREARARTSDGLGLDLASQIVHQNDQNANPEEEDIDNEEKASRIDKESRYNFYPVWETILGIDRNLRRNVLEWILDALPDSFSCNTSRSSSLDSTSDSSYRSDLYDQLTTSPETRFHAAYMFVRYFFLMMGKGYGPPELEVELHQDTKTLYWQTLREGNILMTWDIAVGCLALSVKYHRDVLAPLEPVYAVDFQAMAPHCTLSYEDLESAQREILLALSYSLGNTPQAVLDELWLALLSLRQLLDYKGGWERSMKETWWTLLEAVFEPDVLRFPMSLLSAAALAEGIESTLVAKYESEQEWRRDAVRGRRGQSEQIKDSENLLRRKWERRACREAEGVIQDIQAVLNISDVQMRVCREWLSCMHS